MAKAVFKFFYKLVEFILAFIIVLVLLLTVRLSQGPIRIDNLTQMIIGYLKPSGLQVNLKDAYLELAFARGRLCDIRLTELSAMDDQFVLSVEQANITVNPVALLMGRFVVRDVYLNKPFVQLNLEQKEETIPEQATRTVEQKIAKARDYFENLSALQVDNGEVTLVLGEGKQVVFPQIDITVNKNFLDDYDLKLSGDMYFQDTFMSLDLNANYEPEGQVLKFDFMADNLDVSKMSCLWTPLAKSNMNGKVMLDGQLDLNRLSAGWTNIFNQMSFSVHFDKAGNVYLPAPIDAMYPVEYATIAGQIAPNLSKITISDSSLSVKKHLVTLDAMIDGVAEYLSSLDLNALKIHLSAQTQNIPVSQVSALWPATQGTGAHEWVTQNVKKGMATNAQITLGLQGGTLTQLDSIIDIEEAEVLYMDTMPVLKNGRGRVIFTPDDVIIEVMGGESQNVEAVQGAVKFLKVNDPISYFDLNIDAKGAIADALKLVSSQPLEVCASMPVPCETITGEGKANIQLKFPFASMEHDATAENMSYNVSADLFNVAMPVPQTKWKLENGSFKLFTNNQKLLIEGSAQVDDKPFRLDVEETFDSNSVYRASLLVTPSMIKDYFEYIGDFLKGTLRTEITVRPKAHDVYSVAAEFGLRDAQISLPIGYVKEFGQEGSLKTTVLVEKGELKEIPSVYFSMPEEQMTIKGRVNFTPDKLFELNLNEIKAPRTDAQMKLGIYPTGKISVVVTGPSLDIADLLHGHFFESVRSEEEVKKMKEKQPQDFSAVLKTNVLYLAKRKQPFTSVNLAVEKKNGKWEQIQGSLIGKVPFAFALNADKTALHIGTQDVGTFLDRAGYTDRISGGVLDTTLAQTPDGSLTGNIKIKDFKLTKTPFFIQAATLLGIVDALSGDSLSFDKAIIPFTLSPTNVVTIEDATASGSAVGITARGLFSFEKVDLSGSVVPAYAINSLPGKIPVVGTLFSGEEGGGLFGVSYTVTGRPGKIDFSFNPASLLTPGIFRRLFSSF